MLLSAPCALWRARVVSLRLHYFPSAPARIHVGKACARRRATSVEDQASADCIEWRCVRYGRVRYGTINGLEILFRVTYEGAGTPANLSNAFCAWACQYLSSSKRLRISQQSELVNVEQHALRLEI